jgi:molybdopterin converting factor small subunit
MTLGARLRSLLGRPARPAVRVRLLVKGRIGPAWLDVDRSFALPPGTTLGALLDEADRQGLALREAIDHSPHAASTLMVNGERCPLPAGEARPLADGDEVYLLGPIAGG